MKKFLSVGAIFTLLIFALSSCAQKTLRTPAQDKTALAIPMEAVHTSDESFGYTYKLNIISQADKKTRQRVDITSMHNNFAFATNLKPGKYFISAIEMYGRTNALAAFHHHMLKKPIKFEVFQGKVTLLPYVFTMKSHLTNDSQIQEVGKFQILTQQNREKFTSKLKQVKNFSLWTLYDQPILSTSVLAEEKASSAHFKNNHTTSLPHKIINIDYYSTGLDMN